MLCNLPPVWELTAGMAAALPGPSQMLLGSLGRLRAAWGCRRHRLCLSYPSSRGSFGTFPACQAVWGSRSTWGGSRVVLTVGIGDASVGEGWSRWEKQVGTFTQGNCFLLPLELRALRFSERRVLSYAGKFYQLVCFRWLTFDRDLSSTLLTEAGLLSFKKFSVYHAAN